MIDIRRIAVVTLGISLIVLSVAPYLKARELTLQVPSGWELLGSKRMSVRLADTQQIYAPDGTSTGRYGRPVDHAWFGAGRELEIGGHVIAVLDTYQDGGGCHLKVRLENIGGELTVIRGKSEGLTYGNLAIYVSWARMPPEEGDWRTWDNQYFYGFEEFELSLYRLPTATSVPAPSVVAGILLVSGVLFSVRRRRIGLLCLCSGVVLAALIIVAPGAEERETTVKYARLDWLSPISVSSDADFNRFFAMWDNGNLNPRPLNAYDRWGNLIKTFSVPFWAKKIRSSSDGKRIVYAGDPVDYPYVALLDIDSGRTVTFMYPYMETYPKINWNGTRIAYGWQEWSWDEQKYVYKAVLRDDAGNVLSAVRRGDFKPSCAWISESGDKFACLWEDGRLEIYNDQGTSLWGLDGIGWASFSGSLRYVLVLSGSYKVYDTSTGSLIYDSLEGSPGWVSLDVNKDYPCFSRDEQYVGTLTSSFRIIDIQNGTVQTYELESGFVPCFYGLSPSGRKAVITGYRTVDPHIGMMIAVGENVWSSFLSVPDKDNPTIPVATTDQEILFYHPSESFVVGWKYRLSIASAFPSISVGGEPLVSSFDSFIDPGSVRVVSVLPPTDYVLAGATGNFTKMDNVKLPENRLEIYMDNNKSILINLLGRPGKPSLSSTLVKPIEDIQVSWTEAPYYVGETKAGVSYYELQVDEDESFPNPTTHVAFETTCLLKAPEGGWKPGGKYWVRVRGVVGSSAVASYWSDPVYFEVKKIPVPEHLSVTPQVVSPTESTLLEWVGVEEADFYQIRLDNVTVENRWYNLSYTLVPPAGGWAVGAHLVGVRAVSGVYGESAWSENFFYVQFAPTLAAFPVPITAKPPALEKAAVVPMLPYPLVAFFMTFGQVAGVYTLSVLMVALGLGLIVVGLVYKW